MVAVTSELDLRCATCGGALREATVSPDAIGLEARGPLAIAECTQCGGRYFPERTLDRIEGRAGAQPRTQTGS